MTPIRLGHVTLFDCQYIDKQFYLIQKRWSIDLGEPFLIDIRPRFLWYTEKAIHRQ